PSTLSPCFSLSLFCCYGGPRDLHSFPTRRSSDLTAATRGRSPTGRGARPDSSRPPRPSPRAARRQSSRGGSSPAARRRRSQARQDRKSTRLNSSHVKISYAVFCLKKKTNRMKQHI